LKLKRETTFIFPFLWNPKGGEAILGAVFRRIEAMNQNLTKNQSKEAINEKGIERIND